MDLESTGVDHKCTDCNFKWGYTDDYCPECGGENIVEVGYAVDYDHIRGQVLRWI